MITPRAVANGRFPAAQQLLVEPGNPDRLWLRATHGILTSTDRGCSWQWICEKPLNYGGTEDPSFGVTGDGTVLAGVFAGLNVTRDRGCNWQLEPPFVDRFVVDVTVEKPDPKRALVLISMGGVDGVTGYLNQVWRSVDAGKTWNQVGVNLPPTILLTAFDPAGSDPTRIYVTAISAEIGDGSIPASEGMLLRSDDDGKNWKSLPLPKLGDGYNPFLSAVHPTDPNKIYVRVRGPNSAPMLVDNRLLYSADGGETWQEIMKASGDMLGFALAPDGSKVLIGLGDSRLPGGLRPVDKEALGIYSASTADHRFERISEGHIGCLTWTDHGLYVCGSQFAQGFELGVSQDEGKTVASVMQLNAIDGILQCPSESNVKSACEPGWPLVCETINRCAADGGLQPIERPASCSNAQPDAGTPDSGLPPPDPPKKDDDEGCGCHAVGSSGGMTVGAFFGFLAAAALFAARRRR